MFTDRMFRLPRQWSNAQLRGIAPLCTGDVINVSAWQDSDKEGKHYANYFTKATSYTISNYKAEARGWQGKKHELYLDLEQELPTKLVRTFDVVFNHTTLEHVYDVQQALTNLCALSRDLVIVVVPFLQKMHGDYGDYWRFTPSALHRMFADHGFSVVYSAFNNHRRTAVYLFMVAARQPEKWQQISNTLTTHTRRWPLLPFRDQVGCRALTNTLITDLVLYLRNRQRSKQ